MPHSTEMCFTVLLCSSVLFVKLAIVSVFWAFGRDLTSFPKHPAVTPRPSLPLFSSRVSLLSCALAQLPCFHLGGSLQTRAVMVEDRATHGASEPVTMVTGGGKPVHRFLKGQPKSIGIVLMMMGVCLFMFGIAIDVQSDVTTSADMYSPFWLGTLFFICGLLYLLSERNPSKKIITASLALSIISTIGVICACVDFSRAIAGLHHVYWSHLMENQTAEERDYVEQHYMAVEKMERVFFCHSLIGGILLITMTFFSRAALRSSRTQAVVVMRNLPSAD